MQRKIRVGVVDDHPIFREGIIQTLHTHGDIQVVASGGCAADAIQISRDMKPDVLVLDMIMPGDVIAALDAISVGEDTVGILFVTVVSDEERGCEAIRKGAKGYLLAGLGRAELVRAVEAVHAGECYISPTLATRLVNHLGRVATARTSRPDATGGLSPREQEILSFIGQGMSNKEIGNRLCLSDKTVKHYVTGVLNKLGVRNRVEAAIIATRLTREQNRGSATGPEPRRTGRGDGELTL